MPFVVIGVVLLIIGSAFAVMVTQAKGIEDTADNIMTELDTLDSAIEYTSTSVERGLGEIIFDVSADPDGGSVEKRAEAFKEKSDKWMKSAFPRNDRGVSVTIISYTFILEAEPLRLTSSDAFTDGFTPSYLRATGHYTARFVCGSGTSERTVAISTDGTCALPLAAEKGSLFDSMVSGEGSALSQMVAHQLTALAQYRVLNGYGSLAEYGSMGTMSIITPADVESAYKTSLRALELLVFRSPSEGFGAGLERIDLADVLVSEDGYIEIDLSAVYSQALISIADDLALQWFDYLYGNVAIDVMDSLTDGVRNAWDSLKGFFTGNNEFSAAPYIEQVMRDNGLDADRYARLYTGGSATIRTSEADVVVGGAAVRVPSLSVSPAYPSVDMMKWEGISKFKSNYRSETNEIREWMRSVINTAAVNIGQTKALGTVRVPVDPTDGESFMETVDKTVRLALSKGDSEVERIMTSAIGDQRVADPFYAAIYKVISENRRQIYGVDTFRENIRSSLASALTRQLDADGASYGDGDIDRAVAALMEGAAVRKAVSDYEAAVDGCVGGLNVLTDVPGGSPGVIKRVCTAIFEGGAFLLDVSTDVPERIRLLCSEAVENTSINAYSGPMDMPGTDSFAFTDAGGGVTVERLTVSSSSSPKVGVKGPNDNLKDCVHYVGFSERSGASYSTAFSVTIEDTVEYTVKGSGAVMDAMGAYDSVYKGSSKVSIEVKVVVASGWELAGVRGYTPSNTLLSDAWNALVGLLGAILEPLRKVMSMIMDVVSIMGAAMMECAKYVASVVEKLYNAMMAPLMLLAEIIDGWVAKIVGSVLEMAVDAVKKAAGLDESKRSVSFTYMGFTLSFTAGGSVQGGVSDLLTVAMGCAVGGLSVSGSITIKQTGSGSGKLTALTGNAEVKGGSWHISADIDPLMRLTDKMVSMEGVVGGVRFDVALPELVQYHRLGFALSDIPPVAAVLSDIPLPIPGLKGSIDAGIELKYSIPYESGILINEFELNPPGTDRDNEWVELYNATPHRVDLEGYTIRAGSSPQTKAHTITGLSLSPWERAVITLPGAFLNNDGSALIPDGECVMLVSPDGREADRTPVKKDAKDDGFTWQRVADGAREWTFAKGTPGTPNCGGIFSGSTAKVHLLNILYDTTTKALRELGSPKDTDDLSGLFKKAVTDAIEEGIGMLAACVVEASVYVSLEVTDYSSTLCAGVSFALSIDADFVEEGLRYLVGEIESLLLNVENPYGIAPKEVFANHLYLGVTFYTGLSTPFYLKPFDHYPETKIGVSVDANVAALCRLVGSDLGDWVVTAGVLLMDCPAGLVPPALNADANLDSDLWLMKAVFTSA
ncbi:MAG: lamin tail domain-containing protein [Methanomassiliicoccaceae archaeon]|nr:lamin tail domain-containing protein [Methanomassiliicoccaceae archaeon]